MGADASGARVQCLWLAIVIASLTLRSSEAFSYYQKTTNRVTPSKGKNNDIVD